jgi:hypothetical protein
MKKLGRKKKLGWSFFFIVSLNLIFSIILHLLNFFLNEIVLRSNSTEDHKTYKLNFHKIDVYNRVATYDFIFAMLILTASVILSVNLIVNVKKQITLKFK